MKKLLFVFGLLFISSSHDVKCMQIIKKTFDCGYLHIFGYYEISPKYWPKTVEYLDALRAKYPEHFQDVQFVMRNEGPAAIAMTIFIPKWMAKKIEKDDQTIKDGLEWILLHEAGHIQHSHVMKRLVARILFSGAIMLAIQLAVTKVEAPAKLLNTKIQNGQDVLAIVNNAAYREASFQKTEKGYVAIGTIVLAGVFSLYSRFGEEVQADDYACKHCESKDAFTCGAEFLDKYAPRGLFSDLDHPSAVSRVEKIEKARDKKFGNKES